MITFAHLSTSRVSFVSSLIASRSLPSHIRHYTPAQQAILEGLEAGPVNSWTAIRPTLLLLQPFLNAVNLTRVIDTAVCQRNECWVSGCYEHNRIWNPCHLIAP